VEVLNIRFSAVVRRLQHGLRSRAKRLALFAGAGVALIGLPVAVIDSVHGKTRGELPAVATPQAVAAAPDAGIRFSCDGDARRMEAVRGQMRAYLEQAGIPQSWVSLRARDGALTYTLNTPGDDTATVDFVRRKAMGLQDAVVHLPTAVAGKMRDVPTVSTKEIVLALLQHGRLTEFDCSVESLKDHVGIRQNIVAWAENLDWTWPNGGAAKWNGKYWKRGTPLPRHRLHVAVNDAFMDPDNYGIGCYTATKLVVLQGVLDYYRRVRPDASMLRRVEARLGADGEPLVGVEPGAMWFFEDDYSSADGARPGKLVALQQGVAADNFVPGDWSYLLNTDPHSHGKTGYEGSNMIYLGRDRFDDYYNDNGHYYSFKEKLAEVYQWRHGVFSRVRDAAKIRPLRDSDLLALMKTPEAGGLLESYRGVVAMAGIAADVSPPAPSPPAGVVEFSAQAR
jgi:hypothetical protein